MQIFSSRILQQNLVSSSELSEQSAWPSQTFLRVIHWPFRQVKLTDAHDDESATIKIEYNFKKKTNKNFIRMLRTNTHSSIICYFQLLSSRTSTFDLIIRCCLTYMTATTIAYITWWKWTFLPLIGYNMNIHWTIGKIVLHFNHIRTGIFFCTINTT